MSGETETKKRKHSTLADSQRKHIEKLMRNVDKEIVLPGPAKVELKPPPEIVLNVGGSSAGAGSSDFHTYRVLRRKENARIKLMESEAKDEEEKEAYEQEREELKRKDEEKTAKNRAKRQKRKHGKKPKNTKSE
ncbi:DUF1168-domain-containing protein [Linderina pennispora]|uniref:DUF1168-domain-containing protein n=1 Tax=Linderina pennispora TaxID=61395 RepID=A0A1Y1W8V3_9FUNG|nr:DUF1168-domain-containing protein [Linderina pennispora]ORX69768.1 DUF1168-domain-containing protein [Linderina pennispora]